MSMGAGQGGAPLHRPDVVTTADAWSAAICDRLDALLDRDRPVETGARVKVSEPSQADAPTPAPDRPRRTRKITEPEPKD